MNRILKFIPVLLLTFGVLVGCEGCFDDEVTNKVDAPNFILKRGTNYHVTLTSDTKGATIVYTTDGTDPTSSNTAVEGTELEITFFTKIKAYAHKKGKRDSIVVDFGLPRFGTQRKITYNGGAVDSHIYFSKDCNGKRKVEVFYNGSGADKQWYTYDDDINYYKLYEYSDNDLILESMTKYKGAGEDAKWFTEDDEVDTTYSITVSNNGLDLDFGAYSETLDSKGRVVSTTESGSVTYAYDDTFGGKVSEKNGTAYTLTNVQEYVYQYDNDVNGNPTKKTKYLGYGSDATWGFTLNTYDADGNVTTSTYYWDNAGTHERAYYEYTYLGGNLVSESKYKSSTKGKLRFRKEFEYDAASNVTRVNYFNRDEELEKYDAYTYDTADITKVTMSTFQRPAVAAHEFIVDLKVEAGAINGGSYYYAGGEFDHSGAPASDIIDLGADQKEFVAIVTEKIKAIIKSAKLSSASITLNGALGGDAKILISTYDNNVNIVFEFNKYNDGDVVIDGTIDQEYAGVVIDVSGEVTSGELTGTIYGTLMIADADPDFDDNDYIQESYTVITRTNTGKNLKEVLYTKPGADGDWTLNDSDVKRIKYVTDYNYAATLETKTVFKVATTDANLEYIITDPADLKQLEYRIEYTVAGGVVTSEKVSRNYGSYFADTELVYHHCWSHYWDIKNRLEIDWDDPYWNEDVAEEDRVEWSVE